MIDPLLDLEAIKTVKARYFRYMDTKEWDRWRTLFTDDVEVTVDKGVTTFGGSADPHSVKGADAFVASTRGKIHDCITVHHGHMPEIKLNSPDSATGIWAMEDILEWPGQAAYRGFGHYTEQYRKEADGEWRISRLHLTRLKVA